VDGIRAQIQGGIRDRIIQPFIRHSEELVENVIPTLEQVKQASSEAAKLWSRHIWRTAWITTLYVVFDSFFDELTGNQEASGGRRDWFAPEDFDPVAEISLRPPSC
jgi:hypothetical protein